MGICQYQKPDKSDVGIFKKIAIRRQAPVEDRFQETGEKDMRYDFTKIIDRHGKDAIAVDGLGKNPGFAPEPPKDGFDVIPMWVADIHYFSLFSVKTSVSCICFFSIFFSLNVLIITIIALIIINK